MRRLLSLLLLPLLLNGCIAAVVAGGTETGVSLAENRSIGRKVDDNVIYTDVTNVFIQNDATSLLAHLSFNIRYGRVMLTGSVHTEADAQKAVALTWQAKGVTEVINELLIKPDVEFLDTANDSLIKRNLESRLLITKDVWVINLSLDVVDGTAYMIGRVHDQAELNRTLNVARSTKGVKRVVSHLQISTDQQYPPADPASEPAPSANSGTYSTPAPASNAYPSSAPAGGVEAPGSVSSSDLAPPKAGAGGGY